MARRPGWSWRTRTATPSRPPPSQLVDALRAGGHRLPLVVLSSCSGASGGADGLAATLIRQGADRVIAMQAPIGDTFATALARTLYRTLTSDAGATVAQALAEARRTVTEQLLAQAARTGEAVRPEFAVPTLVAGGADLPLRDPGLPEEPLARATQISTPGGGVRELPVGELIGRRAVLRTATAVLRRSPRDRDTVGDWAGLVVTGIGGIGKTAVAGRILARAREQGWLVAEHVGSWSPPALFAAVADALTDPQQAQLGRSAAVGGRRRCAQAAAGAHPAGPGAAGGVVRRLRTEPHRGRPRVHRPRVRRDLRPALWRRPRRAGAGDLPLPRPGQRGHAAAGGPAGVEPGGAAAAVPAAARAA